MFVSSEVFNLRSTVVLEHFKTLALSRVTYARDMTRPSPAICQGLHPSSLAISGSTYRDWRFETVIPYVWGNYFEEWEVDFSNDNYIIHQRCLHLYTLNKNSGKEKEVLAIHSEPSLNPDGTMITEFKKNPHVHFKTSPSPMSKIHLPLSLINIDKCDMSFEILDKYFELTINMVIDEFDRFDDIEWERLSA